MARKRMAAAGVAGAVVATAVVSLVVAGMPMLNNFLGSSSAEKTEQAPIVITTPATPSVFPTFNRPAYVQPAVPATATEAVKPTTIKVGSDTTGKIMPVGLAGLSMDTDHLVDMQMDPAQSNFAEILKMSGDPVIRFGAQAVDRRFFWTSTDEPIPNWKVVPAYKGDKRQIVKVTPDTLRTLKRLLDAGDARVLLSTDMGHLDPARSADLAKWAKEILGNRLVGISLGNEPNGWALTGDPYKTLRKAPWTVQDYNVEAQQVSAAIAKSAPGVKVIGPEVYRESWWKDFVALKLPNIGAMSYHNYPLYLCKVDSTEPFTRSIANLMSRQGAEASFDYAAAAAKAASAAGLHAWNTETNASSCSGSDEVTRSHATAVWAVNFALGSAEAGVTQLNFHGGFEPCLGGAPMSPLCDTGTRSQPTGKLRMEPLYYGIMMVNKLGAGNFLRSEVDGDENIYAFPVEHKDGTMGVMVVNQNDPAKQAPVKITLMLPGQAATGTMTQLSGPSLTARDQTRIDGEESSGKPLAEQSRIPGFKSGEQSMTLALNSGTTSILNFTF
ncbi:hypothetical protein B5P43_18000 [Bacillus sp. SRB_336]|nr:hypothetical protein B5P43_18000 [Bacillus sp. SRB_336]